ncbi:hypothetical protein [Persicobacter diffluens]|uniref:Lipoprotein n=1 Tax=Persicobacter diffluens TaxID=981 RepID=A0AAN5ANJ5_9BACT|nr:hypothetical protein PEDI_54090 [Persicobacter diffluens]
MKKYLLLPFLLALFSCQSESLRVLKLYYQLPSDYFDCPEMGIKDNQKTRLNAVAESPQSDTYLEFMTPCSDDGWEYLKIIKVGDKDFLLHYMDYNSLDEKNLGVVVYEVDNGSLKKSNTTLFPSFSIVSNVADKSNIGSEIANGNSITSLDPELRFYPDKNEIDLIPSSMLELDVVLGKFTLEDNSFKFKVN